MKSRLIFLNRHFQLVIIIADRLFEQLYPGTAIYGIFCNTSNNSMTSCLSELLLDDECSNLHGLQGDTELGVLL